VLLDAYERLLARRAMTIGQGSAAHEPNGVPELVLAGRATEQSRPWLDRIARAPLAPFVRHIGYVQPAGRRELYEGARLLVQPSFEEGFGLPVLEAMTIGLPVVAANRGALPEVLGDAGPLVDPDEPDQFAAAIGRVLDDPPFAAACAAKGVLRAQRFTWKSTAERTYDAYRDAIQHRQCASA
jgi:glycosyltransferase involved in cell wall biosynthesis